MFGTIWNAFVSFLEQALLWCAIFTGNVGIGIILFTVTARLVILPLTLSSIRSSRKMQELQPMIKELQRKYGKDQKKLQEETVKLYQQYHINPLGGCLPMLLQLPIFIGVYWAVLHLLDPKPLNPLIQAAFQNTLISDTLKTFGLYDSIIYLLHHHLLSPAVQATIIKDPAIPTILNHSFLGIDLGKKPFDGGFNLKHFSGIQYLIFPVLSIVLQLMQQLMSTPRVQDPQQKAMTRAMMFMPLFFAYITLIFPAGAVLYWVTSSAVGIIQQYFTSGWGSLANHLKFLPPDGKPQPGLTPTQTDSKQSDNSPSITIAKRSDFWDVLRPLTEAVVEDTGNTSTSTEIAANQTIEQEQQQGMKQPPNRRSRRRR